MMKSKNLVDRATFVADEVNTAGDWFKEQGGTSGTIEVTLRGETRRVEAIYYASPAKTFPDGSARLANETWIALGMVGRYNTGTKVWPARIIVDSLEDYELVHFGRHDNHPKFNKTNMIWFK